jgi:hypothetical protein
MKKRFKQLLPKVTENKYSMGKFDNECQSFVLNTIKRYKVISALEMTYYTKNYSVQDIERAVLVLWKKNLVYLSSDGGYPKRYKPREEKLKNSDDESLAD